MALKLGVANWRWAGVPFYLRTGKPAAAALLGNRRRIPSSAARHIPDASRDAIPPNRLAVRVQPDEGIKLWMMVKEPGPGDMRLQHVPLDMSFAKAFAWPRRTPMSNSRWMRYVEMPHCSCGATKSRRRGNLSIRFARPGASANRRAVCRRHTGPQCVRSVDRTRWADLERGIRMSETDFHRREFVNGEELAQGLANGQRSAFVRGSQREGWRCSLCRAANLRRGSLNCCAIWRSTGPEFM